MNMFTNYDGAGNGFGDTLVKSECDNDNISVYSSIDGEGEGTVKLSSRAMICTMKLP